MLVQSIALLVFLTRIALIRKRHFHGFSRSLLYLTCQFPDLRAFLLVGRRHVYGQQLAQRVDRHMDFAATLALVAEPARGPLSQVDCNVRASRITALGGPDAPAPRG